MCIRSYYNLAQIFIEHKYSLIFVYVPIKFIARLNVYAYMYNHVGLINLMQYYAIYINTHTHVRERTHAHTLYICIHMHVHKYIYICVCVHVCECACVRASVYVRVSLYMLCCAHGISYRLNLVQSNSCTLCVGLRDKKRMNLGLY